MPKARNDYYVHLFIHSLTYKDELTMENELAVTNFQHDLFLSPVELKLSSRVDDDDFYWIYVVFVDRTRNTMFHHL